LDRGLCGGGVHVAVENFAADFKQRSFLFSTELYLLLYLYAGEFSLPVCGPRVPASGYPNTAVFSIRYFTCSLAYLDGFYGDYANMHFYEIGS